MRKFLIVGLMIIPLLCGCSPSASQGKAAQEKAAVVEDEILVFTCNKDNELIGDLYLKEGTKDKEKISSDVQAGSFSYLPTKNAVIFLDKDENLYIKEDGKEKELIAQEVYLNYKVLSEDAGVVFLKSDTSDLYIKVWDKEREKLGSNVVTYGFSSDGKTVGFVDEDNNLYVKQTERDKERIASNIGSFYISWEGNVLYYFNSDNDLYFRDLASPDNEKIASGQISFIKIPADGQMITYLNEYSDEKGELFYRKVGEAPNKIASDVTDYQLCNGGMLAYYLNEEKNLVSINVGDDNKNKIAEEIVKFVVSLDGDTLVFENTDHNIYISSNGGEKEKIGDGVQKWDLFGNNILFLTEDNELYIRESGKEKEKLASDVQNYQVSEHNQSLVFYDKDSQVFLKVLEKDVERIVENINDFTDVYFSNKILFTKELRMEDLKGMWESPNLIIEITYDKKAKIYYDGELAFETNASMIDSTLTNGTLVLEDNPDIMVFDGMNKLTVERGENQLVIKGITFKKITKDRAVTTLKEQGASKKKIEQTYLMADQIIGTYQMIQVETANFRDTPSKKGEILGKVSYGSEFYIYDTFVDEEEGDLWCYTEVYNDDYYLYLIDGWISYKCFTP